MPHYDMRILYSSAVAQDLWHDLSWKERMFLLHHCEVQRNVFKFHRQHFLSPFSVAYLTSLIQKDAKGACSWVPAGRGVGGRLTINLRILSFSIRSVSFFCSLSVLACQVATALESFWIFPATERWYSLKSFACCKMLFRYS